LVSGEGGHVATDSWEQGGWGGDEDNQRVLSIGGLNINAGGKKKNRVRGINLSEKKISTELGLQNGIT